MMQKEIEFFLAENIYLILMIGKIRAKNFGNITQKDMRLLTLGILKLKIGEFLRKHTNMNFGGMAI